MQYTIIRETEAERVVRIHCSAVEQYLLMLLLVMMMIINALVIQKWHRSAVVRNSGS